MSFSDRRIDSRVNVRVPVRIRPLDDLGLPEQIAESENISRRGIFLFSSYPLEVGMTLEVSLRMPPELVGETTSDMKCLARVVRVQDQLSENGRYGIGLHIEQYDTKPAAKERWVS